MRVGIDPDEDAQLERTCAALADQPLHAKVIGRSRPDLMGNPMGMMGNLQPTDIDRTTPDQDLLERTTGFEPATLTWAKKRRRICSAKTAPFR